MLQAIKFIHHVFHLALLEQDTIRKGRVYKDAMRTIKKHYENAATQLWTKI